MPQIEPTTIYEDNQGTQALAENPQFHKRSKHFTVKLHYTREKLANGDIRLEHRGTAEMTADVLTKPLPKPTHATHLDALGMALA